MFVFSLLSSYTTSGLLMWNIKSPVTKFTIPYPSKKKSANVYLPYIKCTLEKTSEDLQVFTKFKVFQLFIYSPPKQTDRWREHDPELCIRSHAFVESNTHTHTHKIRTSFLQ